MVPCERPYVCGECDFTLDSLTHLKRHIISHTIQEQSLKKLIDCNNKLKENIKMISKNHKAKELMSVAKFSCDDCAFSSTNLMDLGNHITTSHTESMYKCDNCDFTDNSLSTISEHEKSLHRFPDRLSQFQWFQDRVPEKNGTKIRNLNMSSSNNQPGHNIEVHSTLNNDGKPKDEAVSKIYCSGQSFSNLDTPLGCNNATKEEDAESIRSIEKISEVNETGIKSALQDVLGYVDPHRTYKNSFNSDYTVPLRAQIINPNTIDTIEQKGNDTQLFKGERKTFSSFEKMFEKNFSPDINSDEFEREANELEKLNAFRCPFNACENTYTQKSRLENHFIVFHEGHMIQCNLCGRTLSKKTTLKTHMERAHGDLKYNCNDCTYTSSSKKNLQDHIKRKHDRFQFKQTPTHEKKAHMTEIKVRQGEGNKHIKKVSGTFKTRPIDNILVMKALNQPGEPFKCRWCELYYGLFPLSRKPSKTFSKLKELIYHIESYHKKDQTRIYRENSYKCLYCKKSFIQLQYLEKHIKKHSNEQKPY